MYYPDSAEHARLVQAVAKGTGMGEVHRHVARSWRRCLDEHRLDPRRHRQPQLIERLDLEQRQARLAPLLAIARTEMTNLYQQVAGSGYAIVLTDADGVILNYVGDPQFSDTAMRSGLRQGAVWSEAAQGTNGMGTCIVEQKPVIVHRNEHFLAQHIGLTCSAAPIRDPYGTMVAVLDASSESHLAQQHTMVLVNMSAQMIENRMFLAAFKEQVVVRFHSRPEFVSTLGEGAIALDESGAVRGANRSALFQLDRTLDALLGQQVETVFRESLPRLLELGRKQAYHPAPIHGARDGRRFFGVVQLPAAMAPAAAGAVAPARTEPPGTGSAALAPLSHGDPAMERNIRRATRLLDRGIPLLLYGETGTGKGLFARAFHEASARRAKPFVAVNCASIPETLIESELFGYRPGAFTGASRRGSRGKILQAHGGTLFLDEIGDMPLPLQARLLRVLEEREVVPLGGEAAEKVDIAVVSATHRDLEALIAAGDFREDLYYRLQGVALTLPPLRERADREALVRAIAAQETPEGATFIIDDEAMALLLRYDWPGNIRQLCNTLRTVLALCEGGVVRAADLPDELHGTGRLRAPAPRAAPAAPPQDPLSKAECDALLAQLEAMHWNVAKVARTLNLSRNTLYRKMKRYGIRPPR